MAVPCTEHLFLMGRKGVGKSTLLRAVLEGKRLGGFFTRRITGIFERPSIHLLRAAEGQQPSPENLVCLCGERRTDLFDRLGPAALADAADCDVIVMDELGPSEAAHWNSRRRCWQRWTAISRCTAFCSRRTANSWAVWRRTRGYGSLP